MNSIKSQLPFASNFTHVVWVVKDIAVARRFFSETMGINNFSNRL